MRRAFLWLHRWLGLGAMLLVSFLGLSGSLLVWKPEIEARLHPRLFRVQTPQRLVVAPLQPTLSEIKRRFPSRKPSFLFMARGASQTHEWWLDKGEWRVYSDPGSGEILGAQSESQNAMACLRRGHTHLFVGEWGEQVAAWSGLMLFCLCLSGLILWWPRKKTGWKRAFWPQLRTNTRGKIYELHRVFGLWASGFLLLASFTGMALVWHDLAETLAAPLGTANVKRAKASGAMILPLDEYLRRANTAFPEGQVTRIAFPAGKNAPLVVRKKLPGEWHPNGQNSIALDPRSGRVLSVVSSRNAPSGQRLLNLRFPLHTGVWAANWSRALTSLVGLAPLLFSVSGFLMWRARAKRGQSSPRLATATTKERQQIGD